MVWARGSKRKRTKAPVARAAGACPLEADEQAAFIAYLVLQPQPWCDTFFAVPNDGRRGFVAQRLFKKLGGKRGIPDLLIPVASGKYHGLAIEMKRVKGSTTTPEQLEWQRRLREQGWKSEICKGAEQAIVVFQDYQAGR